MLAGNGVTNWSLIADVLCGSSAMQGIHRSNAECKDRFYKLTVRQLQDNHPQILLTL